MAATPEGARTIKSTQNFDLPSDPLELNPTCHHNDEKLFELAEKFVKMPPFKASLFYVWGHGYEFDKANTDENDYIDVDEIIEDKDLYAKFAALYVEEQEKNAEAKDKEKEREEQTQVKSKNDAKA